MSLRKPRILPKVFLNRRLFIAPWYGCFIQETISTIFGIILQRLNILLSMTKLSQIIIQISKFLVHKFSVTAIIYPYNYNLHDFRIQNNLYSRNHKKVWYSTERLNFLAPKIWSKNQKGKSEGPWSLCKRCLQHVGLL